jgi:hypothetical protein
MSGEETLDEIGRRITLDGVKDRLADYGTILRHGGHLSFGNEAPLKMDGSGESKIHEG